MSRDEPVSPMRSYAYLGPAATFTEAALMQMLADRGSSDAVRVPVANAEVALSGVAAGEYSGAVVPIENSLEGGVPATLDALTHHGQLRIVAETVVRVRFVLAALPGVGLENIRRISTHPHAEAQTREWIAAHLPETDYVPASSTAAAARTLGEASANPTAEALTTAVVCPELAATTYGLEVLAADIGSNFNAQTRFIMVRRPGALPEPTGADKTTVVAALTTDRAGALLELLEQFAGRGVNLSRIESRPTGDGLGLYMFSIDLAGHIHEPRVAEALKGVHRVARKLQFLGSYPAADQVPVEVDTTATSASFDQAEAWLADVLGA